MSNRILIIENEPFIRETLTDILDIFGYNYRAVTSDEEAFEILEDYKPDIIVVNVRPLGIDGPTFHQTTRDRSDASILVMTPIASEVSENQGKHTDVYYFKSKGFGIDDFAESIESILEKRLHVTSLASDDSR